MRAYRALGLEHILPRMSTTFSMLSIMNAALISQGMDEIVSEGDGSVEWRLLSRNWAPIVETELETARHHFTRREDFLQNRIDGKYGYDDGYLIPLDASHVRRVWVLGSDGGRQDFDWSSDGSYIYCDQASGIYAEVTIIPDASIWTATFCLGIQQKLEAVILRAFKEEAQEAQAMNQMAEGTLQLARTNSSQQRKAQPAFRPGRIAQARFAGRSVSRSGSGSS